MKKRIVIASHSYMAKGMKESIEFLSGENKNISFLSAYVEEKDIEEDIERLINIEDEIYVLTDIGSGSVTQKFYPYMSDKVHIISGINLPLALSLAIQLDTFDSKNIDLLIEEAKNQIIYINKYALEITDEDE